jgi:hypothetical protein
VFRWLSVIPEEAMSFISASAGRQLVGLAGMTALLLGGSSVALAQNWASFSNQTASRLISSDPNVTTNDVEEKSVDFGDVDQDGDLDLIVFRKVPFTELGGKRDVLFMNEGIADGHSIDGVLVDRTQLYAPSMMDLTNDRDAILVDVTGDGWLDIVTAVTLGTGLPKAFSHPRVYVNRGEDANGDWLGYIFDDVDRIPTMPQTPAFASVVAGDIDGDGDTDLYFTDYSADYGGTLWDRLLINDGNGYFSDESSIRMTSTMLQSAFGTASAMADMNGDGKLDIVKDTALFDPRRVSISYNDADNHGYFDRFDVVDQSAPYFVNVADLNNDGRMDFFIADDGTDHYHLNQGNDAQGMANFDFRSFSGDDGFGGNSYAADLNNDGFKDVTITDVDIDISGCNRRTHIYRNLGNVPTVTLQEQGTLGIGTANLVGTHDVAIFDINNDGWLDMVIGRCNATFVWMNVPPAGLVFTYPDGLPAYVGVNEPLTFRVSVSGTGGAIPVGGTGKIYISDDPGPFVASNMTYLGNNVYETTIPAMACADRIRFYVSADASPGGTFYDPSNAPVTSYRVVSTTGITIDRDDLEGDVSGWSVQNDPNLTFGSWECVDPIGTVVPGGFAAPEDDATAGAENVKAFVTKNGVQGGVPSASDLDGGPTRLISPVINLEGTDAEISYARWFYCDDQGVTGADFLTVEISNNDGGIWKLVQTADGTGQAWQTVSFLASDYLPPTATMRVRFTANDTPNNSITEAGIDNFEIRMFECDATPCLGDIDGDGVIGQGDLGVLLGAFGSCEGDAEFDPLADLDGDGCLGQGDLGTLLGVFGDTCP